MATSLKEAVPQARVVVVVKRVLLAIAGTNAATEVLVTPRSERRSRRYLTEQAILPMLTREKLSYTSMKVVSAKSNMMDGVWGGF